MVQMDRSLGETEPLALRELHRIYMSPFGHIMERMEGQGGLGWRALLQALAATNQRAFARYLDSLLG